MSKYCIKHAGINNMHEHGMHTQHVQHQSICVGVTFAQNFSLDFIYFFCTWITSGHVLHLGCTDLVSMDTACKQQGVLPEEVGQCLDVHEYVMSHFLLSAIFRLEG